MHNDLPKLPAATLSSRTVIDLLPVHPSHGFRESGFFVWCGSLIKADGRYHLFASRWPHWSGFPDGYRDHSEIVRAESANPEGPYEFREVVLAGRGGSWWDGKMCSNPKIVRAGSLYVLYYIASAVGSPLRKVGFASAESISGPWRRSDNPISLGEDANNPAPLIRPDRSVVLAFRDLDLRMFVAVADAFDAPYRIVARDILPGVRIEDPDLGFRGGRYEMLVEDNVGVLTGHERHGALLTSGDGLAWSPAEPVQAYTHHVDFTDGTAIDCERRERPEFFSDSDAPKGFDSPTHLLTGVLYRGETWSLIQRIQPK